jgi:hypothetical protein
MLHAKAATLRPPSSRNIWRCTETKRPGSEERRIPWNRRKALSHSLPSRQQPTAYLAICYCDQGSHDSLVPLSCIEASLASPGWSHRPSQSGSRSLPGPEPSCRSFGMGLFRCGGGFFRLFALTFHPSVVVFLVTAGLPTDARIKASQIKSGQPSPALACAARLIHCVARLDCTEIITPQPSWIADRFRTRRDTVDFTAVIDTISLTNGKSSHIRPASRGWIPSPAAKDSCRCGHPPGESRPEPASRVVQMELEPSL